METAIGRISELNNRVATVLVESPVACARCAAGKGCGVGIFQDSDQRREIQVEIPAGLSVREGESIELTIGPKYLLRAAMLAYGLPLLAMVLSLGLAWMLAGNPGDGIGLLLATFGLGAGLVAGRRIMNRDSICKQFVPAVGRVSDVGSR